MRYRQIFASATTPAALQEKTAEVIASLKKAKEAGELPSLVLPERTDDLAGIEAIANEFRAFAYLIVIGAGGASLGGQALTALKHHPLEVPKVLFLDNIDPLTTDRLLDSLALDKTAFLVISKSGETAETLSQALAIFEVAVKTIGAKEAAKRFTAITTPTNNPLRMLAVQHGWRCLDHDPKLGGRFSVLSLVGLIPACVAGLDLRALRRGANQALQDMLARGSESEVAKGAAWLAERMSAECTVNVWMPYSDALRTLGLWYLQLWSESIGKDGKGTTPALAIGATDQHSQLQLYLGGPSDKCFTLLLPQVKGTGLKLPESVGAIPGLSYLTGHTLGDVMEAEQRATAKTFIHHQHPLRMFELDKTDEETMGALMMHFMLETMIAAHLIGVNAFDQPAVEEGKRLVREYLGGTHG
jgi:glucose-6-phosphate isomerase